MAKKQHGGTRAGAGRPTVFGPRVVWLCRLPLDLADAAEKRREQSGQSQSQLVESALRKLLRGKK
jgi:hypothetical protein